MAPDDQAWVLQWLQWCGVGLEEAVYVSPKRRLACLKYFVGFSRSYRLGPFGHRQRPGWFESSDFLIKPPEQALPRWNTMRVIFATMLYNGQFSKLMEQAGARDRLVSYWEIIDRDEDDLARFVRDGITDLNYKPRPARHDWTNDTFISQRAMKHLERINGYGTEDID
jgi:hypothetical protein